MAQAKAAASGVVLNQFVGRVVLFDGNTTTGGERDYLDDPVRAKPWERHRWNGRQDKEG